MLEVSHEVEMRDDSSKFGVHVFDQLIIQDDSITDVVCGEDEVVGTGACPGWNGFWMS